jgi:lipid A ethanolaminephosphotransferase
MLAATAATAPTFPPRLSITTERLILMASVFWALALNRPFFLAALRAQAPDALASAAFAGGLALMLVALQALLLGLIGTRHTVKPLVALLTLTGALAMHTMQAYGVVIDPSMVRNALHTDPAETRELLTWSLALDLVLYAALPIASLIFARIEVRSWRCRLRARGLLLVGAAGVFALALMWQFQPLASMARNHKEVRYRVTPLNTLWSLGSVLAAEARGAAQPRQAIGLDAAPGPGWATRSKPRLVVLVVGETARADNWGLSGYARQTTPQLAQLMQVAPSAQAPLINFGSVSACGTSTEVSLPCMFAPVGRRQYDEARIRGSESLLHVAARAGVAVHWRDNQSGCKGVCAGLPHDSVSAALAPGLCAGDRCLDEGLLRGLDERLRALRGSRGTQLLVLHMLGNHGPSYHRRYPPAFERFTPVCRHDDLGRCTREEIVNAYDNALLYTDQVLATLIGTLSAHAADVDTAMLYVSDHGESLGEKGLFLHGVPTVIAPREQTQVPMVMWWSGGFGKSAGLDAECLRERARQPVQHDHLFHSLLALLDVKTSLYEREFDLAQGCRTTEPALLVRH